eukprot:5029544-Pleurochrysis_carterae.AAC.1
MGGGGGDVPVADFSGVASFACRSCARACCALLRGSEWRDSSAAGRRWRRLHAPVLGRGEATPGLKGLATLTVASSWRASRYFCRCAFTLCATPFSDPLREERLVVVAARGGERVIAQRSLLLEGAVHAAGEFVPEVASTELGRSAPPLVARMHM